MLNKDLAELDQKIQVLKKNKEKQSQSTQDQISPFTIALEFIAGIIVGTIIGLFLDKQLNSMPICFIICILLGFIASFKNIWIRVNKKNDSS